MFGGSVAALAACALGSRIAVASSRGLLEHAPEMERAQLRQLSQAPKRQTSLICLGLLQIEKMRDVVAGAHLQGK
jgi:hypothetical protein